MPPDPPTRAVSRRRFLQTLVGGAALLTLEACRRAIDLTPTPTRTPAPSPTATASPTTPAATATATAASPLPTAEPTFTPTPPATPFPPGPPTKLGLFVTRNDPALFERVKRLPFASPSGFVVADSESPRALRSLMLAQEQHREVIDAIEHREGARAEALMKEHSRIARRNLREAMRSPETTRVPGAQLIRASR